MGRVFLSKIPGADQGSGQGDQDLIRGGGASSDQVPTSRNSPSENVKSFVCLEANKLQGGDSEARGPGPSYWRARDPPDAIQRVEALSHQSIREHLDQLLGPPCMTKFCPPMVGGPSSWTLTSFWLRSCSVWPVCSLDPLRAALTRFGPWALYINPWRHPYVALSGLPPPRTWSWPRPVQSMDVFWTRLRVGRRYD